MSLWHIIGLGSLGLSMILLVAYVGRLLAVNYLLRTQVSFFEQRMDFLENLAEDRLAKIDNLNELLDVYRTLAAKLVSAHVSATYIHLKIQSTYWQDQDLDKAIADITAVLRDKL